MNLDQFLTSKHPNNSWIKERDIDVYVRRSTRLINEEMYPMLDIGSVEVREKRQGCGIFTEFLSRLEREAKKLGRGVYVESIINSRLKEFLFKHGYLVVPNGSDLAPNMFKLPLDI